MRIYLDTGVFVDYLIYRSHAGIFLRSKGRRNRTIQQLSDDVFECLKRISNSHDGFTSSLTLYEVENALYKRMSSSSKGIPDKKRFLVSSCRCLVYQTLIIKDIYNLEVLDISENTIKKLVEISEFQLRGVLAADSLHMATAILNNIDIILSTDKHLLALDQVFKNQNGTIIKCLDTDDAKNLL